jgi:glucose-6-phosphate-specific signal transduction histidine kinase
MKKILLTFFIIYGLGLNAQNSDYDWKKMDPKQRKEVINNLSPEERKELLKKFRNNMIMDNLNIDQSDKAEFTQVYNEYLESQKQIKSQFDLKSDPEKLSDEEAKEKLQQSFELGQKLLDNRKRYADKMQQVIPCQKVLKLFQSEGMMRDKMNERKPHGNYNTQGPRQNP